MIPPTPANEPERLSRLRQLAALDTEAEPIFDALTETAALVTGAPIALISLIDANRQWFKSNIGLPDTSETPRNIAFCAYAILGDDFLEVSDALEDPRFADNPLVTGDPKIRFYAGAPIVLSDGFRMGTLCVIDRQPQSLSDMQKAVMTGLAHAAALALEQRFMVNLRTSALEGQILAERRMVEERARLSNILEATGAGTWEWNSGTGELRVNERWAEIVGFAQSELEPATLETWRLQSDADSWERLSAQINSHLRGELSFLNCDVRMRHKDGRRIWVRCQGRIIRRVQDKSPPLVYGIIVDVTERKEAERELSASKALLDRAGQLAGVGGWEVDLETSEITWTDQTCRIHEVSVGYRPDMDEALNYYAPEARETIGKAVERAMNDGEGWDLELPFITAKGRKIWVRALGTIEYEEGRPRWLVGAFQDTTLRRRAIQALELSESRFRKLFQHSLGLICTHDLQGVLLSVNPAAAESLGYSVADLMGHNYTDFMPVSQHEIFASYLQRIIAEKTDSGMVQMLARDGSVRIWQFQNILDDEAGEPYVIGHSLDITERLDQESQLRELSIRDPLTGCFNRRFLDELEADMAENDVWACIAIDLDRFKLVNDTYGHQRGDEVLINMGGFLSRHVREGDVVVRSGGDEFLVMLKDADESIAQRVVGDIDAARSEAPIAFTMGHSVRQPAMSLDDTLAAADKRLYETRRIDRAQ